MKFFLTGILALAVSAGIAQNMSHLKLNQVQVIGSHNSYKVAIDSNLFAFLEKIDSAGMSGLAYSHLPITDQLNLGLCNLELDVVADPVGGKYAQPKTLDYVPNQAPYDPDGEMKKPGFKVLHVPDVDFRSHYYTLSACLADLKKWSDAHPNHLPVFITINAKDDAPRRAEFVVPQPFQTSTFDSLDAELTTWLGKEKLVTPDDVRANYPTLKDAVVAGNWPAIKDARGKFIFVLDESPEKVAKYVFNHPSLAGRMMFANTAAGEPEAAILIRNNPEKDKIEELVKQSYIVRTRADADTKQARKNDYSQFKAACQSGAQIITTDYYRKSTHFASGYEIHFPKGGYSRKNPLF